MSLKSVYLPDPHIGPDGILQISGGEHHHLSVARAEPGELIEIFDGKGRVWSAYIQGIDRKGTSVRIESFRTLGKPAGEWILGQSLIRNSAFEFALEKAVELGVTRIVPVIAARSNVRADARNERWERIVVEAAKQSKRYHLPRLDPPCTFQTALSISATSRILFAERAGGPLLPALKGSPVLYFIGPEGGWTDLEMEMSHLAGFSMVSLGTGILKAETAAIASSAIIQFCHGEEFPNRLN